MRFSEGHTGDMPKVSVYLAEDLYRRARDRGLSISALAQQAVADALRVEDNRVWIEAARSRKQRAREDFDMTALVDEVRDEFGT